MTPTLQRAEPLSPVPDQTGILQLGGRDAPFDTEFDPAQWAAEAPVEAHGAGGRQVLAIALSLIAALWLAFTAWSAGRSLAGQPLSSPLVAQWVAVAAGPLALVGLAWLVFGRTRRKEAERFTQSVVTMRTEARSLEALLEVLSQRISDSRTELTMITQHLMQLGDDATSKFSGITREFDSSTERLPRHGEALDRAAESARTDIAVLLDDLPRAEQTARSVAEQLRTVGAEAGARSVQFGEHVGSLTNRATDADRIIGEATDRLAARLAEIDSAGSSAAQKVNEAEGSFSGSLDALLEHTTATLESIRSGIDAQAAAVAALVEQSSAGIGKTGAEAAETLALNVNHANNALATLSGNVAEQERASQRMIAEIDRGLAMIDQRFTELASNGDERANHFLNSLGRARTELDALAAQTGTQDSAIGSLAERTATLRESIDRLAAEVRDEVGAALGEAHGHAERLAETTATMKPEIGWVRDAAVEPGQRMTATGEAIAD